MLRASIGFNNGLGYDIAGESASDWCLLYRLLTDLMSRVAGKHLFLWYMYSVSNLRFDC